MNPVLLDTVGLLALWDEADQWHGSAEQAFKLIVRQGRVIYTTEYVLMECGNAAAGKPYCKRVNALRKSFQQENKLCSVERAEYEAAWAALDRGDAAGAGIVDQLSFQVMRRLGITEALTNDHHFRAAGFVTLF